MQHISGSCLCVGVRFRLIPPLEPVQICHCSQCRKAQGGPFASNIPVLDAQIEWLSGQALFSSYESTPGKQRVFCTVCGSPLYSCLSNLPGVYRIRAGLLDEPLPVTRAFHAYTESACSWWPIDDDLPKFAGAAS